MKNIYKLSPLAFDVTQKRATEPPYSGKYDNFFEEGQYTCVVCGALLFKSDTKYDSGCGWPAFYQPAAALSVSEKEDLSLGMNRVEVVCTSCQAHLGHVFPDGPIDKTGLRYCINSAALEFKSSKQ